MPEEITPKDIEKALPKLSPQSVSVAWNLLRKAAAQPDKLNQTEQQQVGRLQQYIKEANPSFWNKMFLSGVNIGPVKVAPGWLTLAVPAALLGGAMVAPGAATTVGAALGGAGRAVLPIAQRAVPAAKTAAKWGTAGAAVEAGQEAIKGEWSPERILGAFGLGGAGGVAGGVLGGKLPSWLNFLARGAGAGAGTAIGPGLAETAVGVPPQPAPTARTVGQTMTEPTEELGEVIDVNQRISELVASGDLEATSAQLQKWDETNPRAATLLRSALNTAATAPPTEEEAEGALPTGEPRIITLPDAEGKPQLGPDGKPIRMVWNALSATYEPIPIITEEQDEVGNRIRVTINPLTGKMERQYLTRIPVRQELGGREVWTDPQTGEVVSSTDRPPVATQVGGREVWIDPDTGEITYMSPQEPREVEIGGRKALINPNTGSFIEWMKTPEEQRLERISTSMPLLQSLAAIYADPASRLRFAAQEGQRQGLTALPEFSLMDILSSIFGGGTEGGATAQQALGVLGLPGGQAPLTVSQNLSEILGLPAGSPIPIGGLDISTLPDPSRLQNLTPQEQEELDALFEITTGGKKRLSDIQRQLRETAPPGGLGTFSPLTTITAR